MASTWWVEIDVYHLFRFEALVISDFNTICSILHHLSMLVATNVCR